MAETLARKSNLEKLKEAQSKTTTSGFKYWKPQKNGKYLIRFLPNPDPNGIFYKGALQHKVGENYVFCPKTEGKPCPICEKYNKLWKIETPASIKLAREIKPKEQYLYNIVVRQEGEKVNETPDKVFVYMAGKKLHGALMNYFWDEEYGDLTDCDAGYDFILVKEDDPSGSGFPSYVNSKPRKNPSKLFENDATIEKVLREFKNLDAEVEILSYDELKEMLDRFLSNEYEGGQEFLDVGSKPVAAKVEGSSSMSANLSAERPKAPAKPAPADVADDFEASLMASLEEDE